MSSAHSDRNLLFGILALQMDFINRDALVAAMQAWVLEKSKPLGEILVAQGAMAADARALLEPLVQKHVEMHDNDPQKSLASVSPGSELRRRLEQIIDEDMQASLAHVSMLLPAGDDTLATQPPAVGTPTSSGLRFRILRPHAKGGLGQVSVALDEELRREVALKEIQDRYADHPESRGRFVREAEITGGLEHPGIVPVYGLGSYSDGRPFYAMRFIKGDSLQEAIARFHKAESGKRDSREQTLALRQLLGRFIDVCDAIAYAHSRGVLHRDLKPGNVMLGPYGETLVVDWGLAKPMGLRATDGDEKNAERTLRPALSDSDTPTQAGAALGTPAFMPPEQAAGRLDELGPASDVYSLGATLYCLLTGKAPFESGDVGEILRKVQAGDFPRPRQVKRDVPVALQAICLKAMALKPEERYRSAKTLAEDMEHWLADEPVSVYREPWRIRLGRWARRHKAIMSTLVAALLVVALLGGVGWLLFLNLLTERTFAAAREMQHDVDLDLQEVVQLEQHSRWTEAKALLERGQERLSSSEFGDRKYGVVGNRFNPVRQAYEWGLRYQRSLLEVVRRDLDAMEKLDAIRLKRATIIEDLQDIATADQEYAEAFQEAELFAVGDDPARVAQRILHRSSERILHSSSGRPAWFADWNARRPDKLLAALDDWASCANDNSHRDWVLEVAHIVDRDGPSKLKREQDAKLKREQDAKRKQHSIDRLKEDLRATYNERDQLNRRGKSAEAVAASMKIMRIKDELDKLQRESTQNIQALGEMRAPKLWDDSTVLARLTSEVPMAELSSELLVALGTRLMTLGADAEPLLRAAQERHPNDFWINFTLGNSLLKRQPGEAVGYYRAALALRPGTVAVHNNLGLALREMRRTEEALAEFRKAIALDPKFAHAHGNFGRTFLQQGRFIEARQAIQSCLELLPANHPMRQPILQLRQQCEQMIALDEKLPALLKGGAKPADAAEQIGLARLCQIKKRYAAAARFSADAFAAQPKLADELQAGHRYNAACFAVLAAAGKGEDAAKLDDNERTRLRKQALDWLRADLALWSKPIEKSTPQERAAALKTLRHWQQDANLAGLRDAAALGKLPEAERADCLKLWNEVAALLKK